MTIKGKLILLTLSSLFAAMVIAMIGLVGMSGNLSTMKGLYNDRVVPLRDLKVIADMYAVNIVDASHKVRNGNITWAQARNSVAEAQRVIREQWQGYLKTVLVPEEVQIIEQIKPLLIDTDAKIERLQQMLVSEDMTALTEFTIHQLYPAIDPISEQFSTLIDMQLTVADMDYQQMLAGYDTNQMLIWMILLLALIIIALIARSVIMSVSLSTQSMNRAMQSALAGNFSTKAAVHGKDEIAASAQALNQLLASLDQVITEANLVLSAVSQADFKQQMKGQYVGDLDRLKQGVNASAHAVSFMIAELEKVMIGLNAGKFDVQMDAKVPLAFRQLVDTSIGRIEAVVKNINTVMREMSEGRFSARIEAEAQGDLDQMKRHINQSLDGLTHAIEQITQRLASLAEGHLSQPDLSRAQFQGQLAELAQAINQAMRKMKDSVAQATRSASIVGEAANHVSQGSSDLSARVQEQASALEETSATMHEMTSAVQTNTDNARRVADLAKQVERDATSGVVVMQQTTTAMQAIRESSHKISDIVSLIDGIAFQTNLLALNAAVEAARAGEMGRGFAVVAGEVRALAQKSAAAAKDIKLLISDSVQRVEVGTDLAEKSGQMLTTITGSIQQVAQMIDDIARASQEQTIGIHQVHRAMSDIDRVTQENAALVEQTSAAAESLHHEAEDLRHNMSVFKI